MHEEPKTHLYTAIKECLPVLQPLVGQFTMQYRVFRKVENGWRFATELRPNLGRVFRAGRTKIKEAGATFDESFLTRHPDHSGHVGFRGSTSNWKKSHGNVVRHALGAIWNRHKTFEIDDKVVDAIVQEFSDFVDSPVVRLRFQAQLINFGMDAESIGLPDDLVIRRLSEDEVSQHHGGPIDTIGFIRSQWAGPYEFVLEGEFDEPKLLGRNHPAGESMTERAKSKADKALLSLRTFKGGQVGYDFLRFRATKFCPLGLFSVGCGEFVPSGSFFLDSTDLDLLEKHAYLIFGCEEKAMEMACSRLADAEHRTRIEDRIVDAVIGMESLLLGGLDKEARRGELSFRFALNYSMIFNTPEARQIAYKQARDLYGLRSTIAHGHTLGNDTVRVGDEKMTLGDAGVRATTVLRDIIKYFLPQKGAPYKNADFWQRSYFGFSDK